MRPFNPKSIGGLSVLLLLWLSGCAGTPPGPSGIAAVSAGASADGATGALDERCPGCVAATAGQFEPQRHFHHYWGDLEQVVIFDRELTYQPDPSAAAGGDASAASPGALTDNYDRGCRTVGSVEWDLETDGDDVGGDQVNPVNPDTRRADSVFQGTDYLLFETDSGSFPIKWKASDSTDFVPPGCNGILVTAGHPFRLDLRRGEADPPHQFFTSRWQFRSEARYIEPICTPVGCIEGDTTGVASGTFHVRITAHNGGERHLDPAHPDLYARSPKYDLGCGKEVTAERQIIAEPYYKPRGQLENLTFEDNRIVPLQTGKVRVKLSVDYTGPVPGTTWDLWYHGSSTTKFAPARFVERDGDDQIYEVDDASGLEADPPYESFSLWRFELHPKGPGGGPTVFSGTAHICGTAFRDPDAPPLT